MQEEQKKYEEYVAAQQKACEEAAEKEKEFYEKERELAVKLGGAHLGYGYGGHAGAYGGYGGHAGFAGAGYGHPGAYGAQYGAGYGASPYGAGSVYRY